MADYGTPVNQAPSTVKRKKVGEADAATRKRLLAEALHPGVQTTYQQPPPGPSQPEGVSPNTMRLLKNRGRQVDDVVDDAEGMKRIARAQALRK